MNLVTNLLPHQEEAFEKLKGIRVGALFMEQGTGKTRTALEIVKKRLDARKVDAVLWLCPCSVKRNLKDDLLLHCGQYPDEILVRGIESLSSSDRLYLQLLELVETHNVFLVVDETTLTKNPRAIRTERIVQLSQKCRYKLILNGTPISRNEADLFAQFYILDWRILGYQSYYSFAANHLEFRTIRLPNGREIVDKSKINRVLNVDYLTEKIAPYTFQIRKADCLKLPEKRYHRRYFYMDPAQDEEYGHVEQEFLQEVDEMRAETIYKLFTACQHVSSGRHVLTGPTERMHTAPIFKRPLDNPRIKALLDVVKEISDEKAIIFCKYQHEVDSIIDLLPNALEFTGRISQRKRQENLASFRADGRYLVANKTCGAFGLNLQFCHNVIFYNNDFNLATRAQAEDRVHRLGQGEDVQIYDIFCPNSIDGFILDCLGRKVKLADAFKTMIEKEGKEWKKSTKRLMCMKRPNEGLVSSSGSLTTST